jgi:hypothetical protein
MPVRERLRAPGRLKAPPGAGSSRGLSSEQSPFPGSAVRVGSDKYPPLGSLLTTTDTGQLVARSYAWINNRRIFRLRSAFVGGHKVFLAVESRAVANKGVSEVSADFDWLAEMLAGLAVFAP